MAKKKGAARPSLGERVRERRKALKLSQTELAEAVGLSYRTILRLELGHVPSARADRLRAIARKLGVTTAFLLGDEEAAA